MESRLFHTLHPTNYPLIAPLFTLPYPSPCPSPSPYYSSHYSSISTPLPSNHTAVLTPPIDILLPPPSLPPDDVEAKNEDLSFLNSMDVSEQDDIDRSTYGIIATLFVIVAVMLCCCNPGQ